VTGTRSQPVWVLEHSDGVDISQDLYYFVKLLLQRARALNCGLYCLSVACMPAACPFRLLVAFICIDSVS